MIQNARVLQPEFVPGDVRHRDAKVSYLSAALNPITRGEHGETSVISGPSGVGKTCIARYTLTQLQEEVIEINTQYVNCWEDHSRFQALYRILDGVNETLDIHRQSTPTDELLERLRNYDGPPYVVILDEVDQLEDKTLLYDLYRIRELTMILIANREEELFAPLDSRLNSRLSSCERIRFDPYPTSELVEILHDRACWGLSPDAIDPDRLELIATAASGDARAAISILRIAARTARRSNQSEITRGVIEEAVPEARTEVQKKNVDKLTDHQRVLYDIISEAGEIKPAPLYDQYASQVEDPQTRRTMRNYLQKMEHYNLIVADGATKSRRYKHRS